MIELEIQDVAAEGALLATAQLPDWLERCFSQDENQTMVVRIVDADESQILNRDYRGKDKPTNVLSFPFEAPPGVPCEHLGDLVVCLPVLQAEAAAQQKPLNDHFAHLVIHGVLHLQGYDHIEDEEAEQMETLEVELLQRLGITDPYQPIVENVNG